MKAAKGRLKIRLYLANCEMQQSGLVPEKGERAKRKESCDMQCAAQAPRPHCRPKNQVTAETVAHQTRRKTQETILEQHTAVTLSNSHNRN